MLPFPIPRPPFQGLGKELESAVRKAIFDFDLLSGVNRIAIALSGGKDSLSMLFLMHSLRNRGFPPFEMMAIHVEGTVSCGAGVDRSYLQSICKALDVPLIICSLDLEEKNLECYRCSRKRRSLIFGAAKEAGFATVAMGHHRDDSAQTLLLNLLHKAEFASHLPKLFMHRYDITIIRPLIYIDENALRTFAEQQGFLRISCQCPVGQNSQRKKTDRLIQEMENIFPHARGNLARAALEYGSKKASIP